MTPVMSSLARCSAQQHPAWLLDIAREADACFTASEEFDVGSAREQRLAGLGLGRVAAIEAYLSTTDEPAYARFCGYMQDGGA